MKLYDLNGNIVGNAAVLHFYQYGFGSDSTKSKILLHQQQLLNIYKEKHNKFLAKCDKCSDWGTIVGIFDRPYHDGTAKLLATGVSIVSFDDCNRFDKKKGLFIAINRAAKNLNKKVIKKSNNYMVEDGNNNIVMHTETRYVLIDR